MIPIAIHDTIQVMRGVQIVCLHAVAIEFGGARPERGADVAASGDTVAELGGGLPKQVFIHVRNSADSGIDILDELMDGGKDVEVEATERASV
jgi:hypothetical protein